MSKSKTKVGLEGTSETVYYSIQLCIEIGSGALLLSLAQVSPGCSVKPAMKGILQCP